MKTNTSQKNIPSDWKEIKLGDIFEFKNGLNKEKKYFGHGKPIVNYTDVYRGGGLYKNNVLGLVDVNKSELERFEVKRGDVFFTRTSETLKEIGFSAVALDDFKDTVFSGFVLRARQKENLLLPEYAKYYFKTSLARKEITEKSSYTTRALTSGTSLNHVSIILPPLPEQNRIVQVLETWDNAIEKLNKKIEIKKNVKKFLMSELLSGKKRLKGFGGEWEIKNIESIIKAENKTSRQSGDSLDIGSYPFFNNSSKSFNQYLNEYDFDGEYIIANTGGVAYFDYYNGKFSVMSDCFVFRAKYNCRYLFFKLKEIENTINHEGFTGSGIKHLDKKYFFKLKINLPEIKEQEAIAEILVKADEEIEGLEKKLDIIKKQKKYLLNNLITGKIRTPETLIIKT